ncbi:MAG TPA: DUF4168 domain-containing protein [Casimicrobiaceae bacterium]|nr:DUF4168 domain-containing protein [Casimicrobiaceae bacterium]
MIRSTILALTFAAFGAAPLSASADQLPSSSPEQSPRSSEQTAPSADSSDDRSTQADTAPGYSDAELKSFAGAVVEVHRINDAYIPKLLAASTPDEEQQLEAAALHEMVQAVEKEGISVEKYEEILTKAQTNRDIAYRLKQPLRNALSRVWT